LFSRKDEALCAAAVFIESEDAAVLRCEEDGLTHHEKECYECRDRDCTKYYDSVLLAISAFVFIVSLESPGRSMEYGFEARVFIKLVEIKAWP